MKPALYIASPLGFTEHGRLYNHERLIPRLRKLGFEILDPWADPEGKTNAAFISAEEHDSRAAHTEALQKLNRQLGARNVEMLRAASLVLAILDGPDVDSGTAAEIGFAAGLPRPIVGLRSDMRLSGDNEGTPINLQVGYFIELSGGHLVRSEEQAIEAVAALAAADPSAY